RRGSGRGRTPAGRGRLRRGRGHVRRARGPSTAHDTPQRLPCRRPAPCAGAARPQYPERPLLGVVEVVVPVLVDGVAAELTVTALHVPTSLKPWPLAWPGWSWATV